MLFAAAGMLIPLAIHLWNRRPPRLLPAGSIRWFRGSTSQSARSLQLKNLPLLLLRCLILLAFSLLLAGLFWQGKLSDEEIKSSLYLVEARIASGKSQDWVDSLGREGKEARLLAPGLPPLADSIQWKEVQVDIWGIMQEADAREDHKDTVWIHSPLLQKFFSGERPQVFKHFIFEEADYSRQPQNIAVRLTKKENILIKKEMAYSPERIAFNNSELPLKGAETEIQSPSGELQFLFKKPKVEPATPDTFFIAAKVSKTYEKDAEIIRQAFEVLDNQLPELKVNFQEEGAIEEVDLLLWFSKDSLPPEIMAATVPVLRLSQEVQPVQEWLLRPDAGKNQYILRDRPLPVKVTREELAILPLALLELLPAAAEQRYAGYLQMPLSQAQPYQLAGAKPESSLEQKSLHEWLWVLLVVLFMVERIWANLK